MVYNASMKWKPSETGQNLLELAWIIGNDLIRTGDDKKYGIKCESHVTLDEYATIVGLWVIASEVTPIQLQPPAWQQMCEKYNEWRGE